jgi:hypothetical protein
MGERECQFAVEMATVIAGSREELRARPPLSLVVCTIAPLMQDHAGIEGAMVMAAAGIPVGFLAMPTLGTTAPATMAGAFAMADAENISKPGPTRAPAAISATREMRAGVMAWSKLRIIGACLPWGHAMGPTHSRLAPGSRLPNPPSTRSWPA